ncbi:MAG: FGGY family carbohydrate kinase [Eubacteriales bacterium]|nr:FGGY family carbohydrate kinase [Eubacteriales bacterium]
MKKERYYLSLDLGTQGTKAAIINQRGTVLQSQFTANCFFESESGEISISGENLRKGVRDATVELLKKTEVSSKEIQAVSVVGMMAGIIGIDQDWEAVTPYDTGLDKRCETAILEMQTMGESEVIRLSGCPIIVAQGAKMYWWKTRRPAEFAKVKKFVPVSTYICGCMAGLKAEEAYIDYTQIHLTCFADIEHEQWSDELLDIFDFPKEKLPRIVAPFDIIGHVNKEWAEGTGLEEGTPILAGCGDTAASSLGAGLVRENMILDVAGTASVVSACVKEYKPDTEKRILIYPKSVIPGLWTPFGFVLGGEMLSWYYKQVGGDKEYTFEELAREAEQADSRDLFFLPYFAGRICPSNPSFSGHWEGLKFFHGKAHLFKSIMESISYEYRLYLERIKELFPSMEMKEMITSAGGARSESFIRIKADVLQMPVISLQQKDTSHIAAALIAGYGLHHLDDIAKAAAAICEELQTGSIKPDKEKAAYYDGQYEKYLQIVDYMTELHKNIKL